MNRISYYLTAKNQYSLHSPFVFDFYCNVLSPRLKRADLEKSGLPRLWRKNIALCYKLADYYGLPNVVFDEALSSVHGNVSAWLDGVRNCTSFEMMELGMNDGFRGEKVGVLVCRPENFEGWMERLSDKISNDTVFVIPEVHGSPHDESRWGEMMRDGRVTLSLDVFSAGLLFFRKELSRQHFLLR